MITRFRPSALSRDVSPIMLMLGLALAATSYLIERSGLGGGARFATAALSLGILGLSSVQFIRWRSMQSRYDELTAILDAVPHVLFFKNTAFRFQALNAEFGRVFQVDVHAALGKCDAEVFGPELAAGFATQDAALIAEGDARTFDDEITVSGVVRSFQSRKQPVYDRRGRFRGIVGVSIDVTEEQHLKRQIEDANARLGAALGVAQMGVLELDIRSGVVHADERVRHILDIDHPTSRLSDLLERMHPDDARAARRRLNSVRQEVGALPYEFRVVDRKGTTRWVEAFASPNKSSTNKDWLIGIARDITDRRLAELALGEAIGRADHMLAALEESRSDLALALSIGGLGVWRSATVMRRGASLADAKFMDTSINADVELRRIFGQSADSLVTYRRLLSLVHPDDRKRVAAEVGRSFNVGDGVYRDRFRIRGLDGDLRAVEVRGSLRIKSHTDPDKIVVSLTGIGKDITKDEALKADLAAKVVEARAAGEAKDRFLATISHEVRTPLNGILGMLELVLGTTLEDEQRVMLLRSQEAAMMLLTIINDILDFSKITAGKLLLEDRVVSLSCLVDGVCATMRLLAGRKGIDLTFRVDPRLPPFIVSDPVRLKQILTNLVGNAVKFTDLGEVKVLACEMPEGQLQLSIEDTGIGIPPEAMESIFLPFVQADVSTTRCYGGSGLGLSIVHQLVEAMGGSIRCESAPSRGSRFIVSVPLRPWRPEPLPPQRSSERVAATVLGEAPPIGAGRRILLAEDNPINREVMQRQLARLGFECDCVEDGEQAWARLQRDRSSYSALLTDCNMPNLDGYRLITRIRDHEKRSGLPALPVIALTANALRGDAERSLSLGMTAHLSKPASLDTLRKTLAQHLSNPSFGWHEVGQMSVPTPGLHQPSRYPRLAELCMGNEAEIVGMLNVFVASANEDLAEMDRLHQEGDYAGVKSRAHRLQSGCLLLDEFPSAVALEALEALKPDVERADVVRSVYETVRREVSEALSRARAVCGVSADLSAQAASRRYSISDSRPSV